MKRAALLGASGPVAEMADQRMKDVDESKEGALDSADIARILKLLPHRYPFLMIDRIYDMKGDESAVGVKNVTVNEPYFAGHFPGFPVMPGVMIVEGMAQTAGALCIASLGAEYKPQLIFFMGIDRAKFRKPVRPGDQLEYHVRKMRNRGRAWRFKGEGKVNGAVVAEAEISAMILDSEDAGV